MNQGGYIDGNCYKSAYMSLTGNHNRSYIFNAELGGYSNVANKHFGPYYISRERNPTNVLMLVDWYSVITSRDFYVGWEYPGRYPDRRIRSTYHHRGGSANVLAGDGHVLSGVLNRLYADNELMVGHTSYLSLIPSWY